MISNGGIGEMTVTDPSQGGVRRTPEFGNADAKTLASPLSGGPAACDSCRAMTTTEIRIHLDSLAEERMAALAWGADAIPAYLDDLEREIEDYRSAYVGAAVTEIASFRAQLSGPQVG
jgi:hypothetical protein